MIFRGAAGRCYLVVLSDTIRYDPGHTRSSCKADQRKSQGGPGADGRTLEPWIGRRSVRPQRQPGGLEAAAYGLRGRRFRACRGHQRGRRSTVRSTPQNRRGSGWGSLVPKVARPTGWRHGLCVHRWHVVGCGLEKRAWLIPSVRGRPSERETTPDEADSIPRSARVRRGCWRVAGRAACDVCGCQTCAASSADGAHMALSRPASSRRHRPDLRRSGPQPSADHQATIDPHGVARRVGVPRLLGP